MLTKFIALSLVLSNLVSSFLEDKPYDFRPESRHYDINEGEDCYIGFDEIDKKTNFTHCYIESATYNVDYPLSSTNYYSYEVGAQTDSSNGFTTYNGTKICAFIYYTVDDKVPLKWTIKAYDDITKTNFTEEVTITFYYNMPVYQEKLIGLPTASVVNFFDSGQTKMTKCTLVFDNTTINLEINAIKVSNDTGVFKSRLVSLGGGRCGYKINKLVEGDNSRDLTLYTTDDHDKVYRHSSVIIVYSISSGYLKNRTLQVFLGTEDTVICGKETDSSINTDQKFCHLFNPQGELVSQDHMCDFHLDIVTINDLGTWKCLVGLQYITDVLEFTAELVEKKFERVDVFTNDTDPDYFIVGCQMVNFEFYLTDFCRLTRPDGKMFTVSGGSATEYYNTFTTDLENGKCSLEILKPLREEDKGTWKCEFALSTGETQDYPGAFLNVERPSEPRPYSKSTKKNVRMSNSFTIDCAVPYSSDHCYIIAPNGTQFKSDKAFYVTSGVCHLKIDAATPTDNGTWTCSIAQSNGVPDDKVTVEVSIVELKVLYTNAEALVTEEVELICNTNGIPIEYCRFVSPAGTSYSLRMENKISTKIAYKGRGLEYGDCGVKISAVDYADAGHWTCHISSGRFDYIDKTDITRKVELTVSSPTTSIPSLAESVGIGVGVLVVVIVVGGFVFYRYSRRWRARRNIQASVQYAERTSNTSQSSGEGVILSVPQSSYNTAQ